ncbi:MAG: hypothetical protein LJE62_01995 [Silicimonas sp.]|jgi:hypothetical protein|nr:hypothetical protein [Silicimonas sp.]
MDINALIVTQTHNTFDWIEAENHRFQNRIAKACEGVRWTMSLLRQTARMVAEIFRRRRSGAAYR